MQLTGLASSSTSRARRRAFSKSFFELRQCCRVNDQQFVARKFARIFFLQPVTNVICIAVLFIIKKGLVSSSMGRRSRYSFQRSTPAADMLDRVCWRCVMRHITVAIPFSGV